MMNILNLSAKDILAIKIFSELFTGTEDENKKTYRMLLKKWHPDMNSTDTSDVFVHITQLYDSLAINIIPKSVEINGKSYDYIYDVVKDLYTIYYTDNGTGFLIKFNQKADGLKQNYKSNLTKLQSLLKNHKFEDRYKDLLSCNIYENKEFAKIRVPAGYVPLNLALKYIISFKDWKISAYIISRLYDTALLYKNAGLSCIGFDPDFIFLDTKKHQIIDLSALFFSTESNKSLSLALTPMQASAFIKDDLQNKKCSDDSINSMINSLGLMLSGDLNRFGNINVLDDSANKEMVKIISGIGINVPIRNNYEAWQTKLVQRIFNERSFYKKEIVFGDLTKYIGN